MDIRKVKKLIEMLEESSLNELEINEGEESVKLVKSAGILQQAQMAAPLSTIQPTIESNSILIGVPVSSLPNVFLLIK